MNTRKYAFSWYLLGELKLARPNLGPTLRLEVYRLMQFCFRDVLEIRYGSDETDKIFREAGFLAGKNFFENMLSSPLPESLKDLLLRLQNILKDLGVGILRVEKASLDSMDFVLSIAEDLDCSGLPELGYEICIYDEGFLAGVLESFTGRPFKVKEVDCWCTNERTCRFEARPAAER